MDYSWEILDRIANIIEVAWLLHLIYQNRDKLTRQGEQTRVSQGNQIRIGITDPIGLSDSVEPTVIPGKNPTEVLQELLWWYVLVNQDRTRK